MSPSYFIKHFNVPLYEKIKVIEMENYSDFEKTYANLLTNKLNLWLMTKNYLLM